jgi:hypothetical protein
MKAAGTSTKLWTAVALLVVALLPAACSESGASNDPTGEARAEALRGQAKNDIQRQQAEAVQELLGNFREGPTPPMGWPSDIVPVPAGAKPVASIDRSKLADGAVAMTMFYSSSSPPEDVQSAFESGLEERGWNNIQAARQGELLLVDAEKDAYSGIFMAGVLPSTPKLRSGQTINVMVVLGTKE